MSTDRPSEPTPRRAPGHQPQRMTRRAIRRLVLVAMLFAMAIALQWLEAMLPSLPTPVPMKFGLSNIAVMYALYFLGARDAYALAVLKSGFVLMTRSFLPAGFSLAGGLLSVTVMLILERVTRRRISWLLLSVSGAITHNLGQFTVLRLVYPAISIVWLLPFLIVAGIGTGLLSAALLQVVIPSLERLGWRRD